MDTVRLHLKQDYRLRGVLYRQGRGVEMPEDVAIEAGLYEKPASKKKARLKAEADTTSEEG